MTEAFKQWWSKLTYQPSHPANDALHVIRCFIAEVNKKALESDIRNYQSEEDCVGWAFRNLTRELIGDER